jgi:hypothetical protein
MHRSGTSALTRALAAVGVYLGDRLMPGQPDNPKGFFEDLDLTAINLNLLTDLGCHWDSLFIADWQTLNGKRRRHYLQRAAKLIRKRFGSVELWGFKDPRVTRLLSFWNQVLDMVACQPVFVMANRHPLSVAASLAKRDRMPLGQALILWVLHQSAALEILSRQGGLVVDFDLLLENPGIQLQRLRDFLAVPVLEDSKEEIEFNEQFLDGSLRHNHYQRDGSDLGSDELGCLCRRLYLHLQAWAEIEDAVSAPLLEEAATLINEVENYCARQKLLMDTVDSLAMRNYQLTGQHRELDQQYYQVTKQHYELDQRYHELAGQHHELTGQHYELDQRYHELARQHQELIGQHHELDQRYHELARQHHELTGQRDELIGWLEKLWSESCSWKTLAERTRQEMEMLSARLRDSEFRVLRYALKNQ